MSRPFRVFGPTRVDGIDDLRAVLVEIDGDNPELVDAYGFTIAWARELSHELAVAADEAEAKALNQPSLP